VAGETYGPILIDRGESHDAADFHCVLQAQVFEGSSHPGMQCTSAGKACKDVGSLAGRGFFEVRMDEGEVDPRRPCTMAIRGYGGRVKRSTCADSDFRPIAAAGQTGGAFPQGAGYSLGGFKGGRNAGPRAKASPGWHHRS
jgi:hypothetical protein